VFLISLSPPCRYKKIFCRISGLCEVKPFRLHVSVPPGTKSLGPSGDPGEQSSAAAEVQQKTQTAEMASFKHFLVVDFARSVSLKFPTMVDCSPRLSTALHNIRTQLCFAPVEFDRGSQEETEKSRSASDYILRHCHREYFQACSSFSVEDLLKATTGEAQQSSASEPSAPRARL